MPSSSTARCTLGFNGDVSARALPAPSACAPGENMFLKFFKTESDSPAQTSQNNRLETHGSDFQVLEYPQPHNSSEIALSDSQPQILSLSTCRLADVASNNLTSDLLRPDQP